MVKWFFAVTLKLVSSLFLAISVSWDSCYQDSSLKGASLLLKSNLALKLVFALCSAAALEEKWLYVPVSELSNWYCNSCPWNTGVLHCREAVTVNLKVFQNMWMSRVDGIFLFSLNFPNLPPDSTVSSPPTVEAVCAAGDRTSSARACPSSGRSIH